MRPSLAFCVTSCPPRQTGFAGDITPQSLVSLLSKNTNILLSLSSKQTPLSSLASEFSLILPPPGTPLISHFPKRDTPVTVIPVEPPQAHHIISPNLKPVWFSGVPQALGNNPMLVPLLKAPAQAFASDADSDSGADALVEAADKSGEGLWAGSSLSLVTGFQALSNARATWVGGVEMFTDEFMNKEVSKCVSRPCCVGSDVDMVAGASSLATGSSPATSRHGPSRSRTYCASTMSSITVSTRLCLARLIPSTTAWYV